jgi:predicted esterase
MPGLWMKLLTCVLLSTVALAQPAWNEIDPSAGDFLDLNLDSLQAAAHSAYQARDYAVAARLYLEALNHDITNSGDIYNLACCYGLLGKETLAARYLVRAVRAGFDDLEHVRRDPDFDSVRSRPVFAATVESASARAEAAATKAGLALTVSAQTLLPVYVHLPAGYDSTRAYPLLLGLHGYGSNPRQFARLYERAGSPKLIFAALQAPYPMAAGKEPGYSWVTWSKDDSTARRTSSELSTEYIVEAARQLASRYRTSGTWLLGFSQGCGMAYATGLRHSDRLKGIICFGGGFDTLRFTAEQYATARELPVFSSHGLEDRVVEHAYGAASREFLARQGFKVTVADFPGGHSVPEEPLTKAVRWMGVK